jgi:segregation and condensation protein A
MLAFQNSNYLVNTQEFDGPLELLLYLVKKSSVDVKEIEIAPITDAYLQHIKNIELLNLDVAGEFIWMAATLCYLKSCELLPNLQSSTEEEEDPREVKKRLFEKLRILQRIQLAAQKLEALPQLGKDRFTRSSKLQMFSSYVNSNDSHNLVKKDSFFYTDSTPMDLLKIYKNILNRKNKKHPVHIIKKATYSVKDMGTLICKRILTSIKQKSICTFAELLQDHSSQADRVLCFVVLLELSKFQYVHLSQENHLSEIDIHPTFCELPKLQEFDSTNVATKSSLPKLSLHY